MNCPFCNSVNDDENVFCVSCGKAISNNPPAEIDSLPATQAFKTTEFDNPESVQTAYPPTAFPNLQKPQPNYATEIPDAASARTAPKSSKGLLYAFVGLLTVLVLGGAGFAGFYFWQNQAPVVDQAVEVLPDHLGMFLQNKGKTKVIEINRNDAVNVLDQKEKLEEIEDLPVWENDASLILYTDSNEISSTDLKLIPLDSIEEDGTIDELDFQVSPIDGKPSMKRLRVSEGLADGKYIFALLEGNLDDGKHKLWAFQVNESDKEDNDDIAKSRKIEMKNESVKNVDKSGDKEKPTMPAPTKEAPNKAEPPSGAVVGFCNGSNVVLRSSPSLNGAKIGKLSMKQRLYILRYSDNYDNWKGTTANWAYIQTESGKRGWVFTPFVSY